MNKYFLLLAILAVSNVFFGQGPLNYSDFREVIPIDTYTKNGTQVRTHEYKGGAYRPSDMYKLDSTWISTYGSLPGYALNDSATYQYNCHSYAFLEFQGMLRWLINMYYGLTDLSSTYLKDGSYTQVSKEMAWSISGGKVVWNVTDHSAEIVTNNMDFVRSKCGVGPLVKHKYNDGLYPGSVTFYLPTENLPSSPTIISGPDLVPCSGTVKYSINGSWISNINWTTSNLTIVSGQGTNEITVSKTSGNTSQGGQVFVSGTFFTGASVNLSKTVAIGVPHVNSITANTYAINAGGFITFTADPIISSPGSYEWMVSPSTNTTQYVWNVNKNDITFYSPGTYTVGVRTYVNSSPCVISAGVYKTVTVNVY